MSLYYICTFSSLKTLSWFCFRFLSADVAVSSSAWIHENSSHITTYCKSESLLLSVTHRYVAFILACIKLAPDPCGLSSTLQTAASHYSNTFLIYCGLWKAYWCESHFPSRVSNLASCRGNKGLLTQLIIFFHQTAKAKMQFSASAHSLGTQTPTCKRKTIINYININCLWCSRDHQTLTVVKEMFPNKLICSCMLACLVCLWLFNGNANANV